ncbi:nitrilase family protein [Maribacter algarum]|uniref:Omega-amidase YafV n=1 Tax=Maribacter algarum (ex Zhang et al. 2020) TaxID=2578118 RepID=A0A5S3PWI4_9FLAO|nr:nitrilase family protein [Maribacter algarum]TMM59258.1 nitrilase family protein [Maribacter algarum]
MAKELKVALIQSSLIWENPEQNRTNFSKKISSISSDVDLIILPEMFTTGFTMNPENLGKEQGPLTLEWMQKISREKKAALTGSLPFYENGSYTNRLFFVKSDGNYHHYDKRHTFTLAGEDKVYKAGSERLIVEYRGFRICPMVCYDLRFPVWARNTENYDVLIYAANWPKPRIAAWDTLLKARAIENMTYCIGVNRIGIDESGHEYPGHSAVYDCLGKQEAFSEKEEVVYTVLSKEHITSTRNQLKFLEDRDTFNFSE